MVAAIILKTFYIIMVVLPIFGDFEFFLLFWESANKNFAKWLKTFRDILSQIFRRKK